MSVPYRITIRVSEEDLDRLMKIREISKYETISEVIRDAIKEFLEKYDQESNVKNVQVKLTSRMVENLNSVIQNGEAISIEELIRTILKEYMAQNPIKKD
ncbi:MAG: ribbon-helix-helix domain-containing protein [Candidatus Thermoplasmatota archaeon]|nr:ribbon-helix-helix domain-containing protein [Candidatus Thermoplasmatota archaeon]